MSASFGLVRFKSTGNIYYGCYEGTSDIFNPYLCTPEECYDEDIDCYRAITYCRNLALGKSWAFPDHIDDLDEVEIYSDYGGGFYWNGTGSESIKMIKEELDPLGDCYPWDNYSIEIKDGRPQWVKDFLEEIENEHN